MNTKLKIIIGLIALINIVFYCSSLYKNDIQNNQNTVVKAVEDTTINEDTNQLQIAAMVNGELSTSFPTTSNYVATVYCVKNGSPANATGTAKWNGTKWLLSVSNFDPGKVICNINFLDNTLTNHLLADEGGKDSIIAKGNPDFNVANSPLGIFAAEDEYGTSYYFRGAYNAGLKNNLIFAGYQWKIIRINGDGSIRIIFNGTEVQFNTDQRMNISTYVRIKESPYNSTATDAKHLGYMYGGISGVASTVRNGNTSTAATFNETSSTAKLELESWYSANIANQPAAVAKIVDNIFCNDRQLASEVGGPATGPGYGRTATETLYAANYRISTLKPATPTLKCAQKNDRFTASDTTKGNGALDYPVGLITVDEIVFAGIVPGSSSSVNYLFSSANYWTMTPSVMVASGNSNGYFLTSSGAIMSNFSVGTTTYGLRPVINIDGNIKVSGTGTMTDPYKFIS